MLLVVVVCSSGGRKNTGSHQELDTTMEEHNNLPGGYHFVDVQDTRVIEAANFALETLVGQDQKKSSYAFQSLLNESGVGGDGNGDANNNDNIAKPVVLRASQQVVAGMNYRLTIALLNSVGDCLGGFKCIVYNRFGELSVTTWGDEVSCEDALNLLNENSAKEEDPEKR